MSLETTFNELSLELSRLREELTGLRVTIVEDKPLQDGALLADDFGDAAEELLGLVEQALARVNEACQTILSNGDLTRVRRALIHCHETAQQLMYRFLTDMMSYDQIRELMRLGRARGGEWQAWAGGVKEVLERCQPRIFVVNRALFLCWNELAEQSGKRYVNLQATGIHNQLAWSQSPGSATEGGA